MAALRKAPATTEEEPGGVAIDDVSRWEERDGGRRELEAFAGTWSWTRTRTRAATAAVMVVVYCEAEIEVEIEIEAAFWAEFGFGLDAREAER